MGMKMSVYKGTMGDDHVCRAEYINVVSLHGCMKDGYGDGRWVRGEYERHELKMVTKWVWRVRNG